MSPATQRKLAKSTGVAFRYVERERGASSSGSGFRKSFMHNQINDRPFDVSVVNVSRLRGPPAQWQDDHDQDGMISRVSSLEDIPAATARARFDPTVTVVEDAAYAAALKNDLDSSLPRTAPGKALVLQSDPTELAYSVSARLSRPSLGFDPSECHEGIMLTDSNHCAIRAQERGLYKTVRSKLSLTVGRRSYFEMFVHRSSSAGGICVGLSTRELPLSCLCGTRPNSIGFNTSGNVVRTVHGNPEYTPFGDEHSGHHMTGCSVGVFCVLTESSEDTLLCKRKAFMQFFVNGVLMVTVDDFEFLGSMDVFPTLSLFARDARVYSLFSADHMIHSKSLPEGEPIYALDGEQVHRESDNTPQSLGLEIPCG